MIFGTRPWPTAILIFTSLVLNVGANLLVSRLNGLLFLDMLGTALAAMALGPWWAASVGLCTNIILARIPGHVDYLNYAVVNVLGGIVWGWALHTRFFAQFLRRTSGALLLKLLLLGLIGGFVCSASGTFTRFHFSFWVTQDILNDLQSPEPDRQAPDTRVLGAARDYLRPGDHSLKFVALDSLSMFPDKIISVAFAALVFYYFFPWLSRGRGGIEHAVSSRSSAAIFLSLYLGSCLAILRSHYINSNYINSLQVATWATPAALALFAIIWNRRIVPETAMEGVAVDDVYKDILGLVVSWYTLMVIFEFPYRAPGITKLVTDGLAIFALLVYLPLTLKRYLERYLAPRPALIPTAADE